MTMILKIAAAAIGLALASAPSVAQNQIAPGPATPPSRCGQAAEVQQGSRHRSAWTACLNEALESPLPSDRRLHLAARHPSVRSAKGLLQGLDVELDHLQHRIRGPFCPHSVRVLHHLAENAGNDLPGKPIAVLEPAALLLFAALAQRVPEPVNVLLRVTFDDEGHRVIELV